MMTRNGYENLATSLKSVKPKATDDEIAYQQWRCDLYAICAGLEKDNPQFNRGLFLAECGMFSG